MATWSPEDGSETDFRLVMNSWVTMFWQSSFLDNTVEWLQAHNYEVATFDAESWTSRGAMLDAISRGLSFPSYFGRNLDALNDCMRDVASGDYGWDPDAKGVVFVLRGFHQFAAVDKYAAQVVLEVFADAARSALLIGNRLICLVQSDDPELSFDPVGATPVMWNEAEWLNSKRGL
jgi:Barstar (barnase inhibitor)